MKKFNNYFPAHQFQYGKKETKNMLTGRMEGDNSAYCFTAYLKKDPVLLFIILIKKFLQYSNSGL